MMKRLLIALLLFPTVAFAQNLENVPGPYLSGSPPTGFGTQQFQYNCTTVTPTAGTCSPVVQVGNANANGQNTMNNSQPVVLPAAQVPYDKCFLQQKFQFTFISSATAMTQLIGQNAGTIINICSISIRPTLATVFSLTEGTGTNCGTATVAVYGGSNGPSPTTAAASGVPYSGAGDGIAWGTGLGTVMATHVPNDALCFQQTVAESVSITFEYVQTLP
jgi:hypothetical protein